MAGRGGVGLGIRGLHARWGRISLREQRAQRPRSLGRRHHRVCAGSCRTKWMIGAPNPINVGGLLRARGAFACTRHVKPVSRSSTSLDVRFDDEGFAR